MRVLALGVVALALWPLAAGGQERDTVSVGERTRLMTSGPTGWQTAHFLGAGPDSVFLGADGGWLRAGVPRTSIERVQVLRPSGHGAAIGALAGAAVGAAIAAVAWLPLTLSSSFDLSTGDAVMIGAGMVAIPAALGALLGYHQQPRAWHDAVLPARPVPGPLPGPGALPATVYLFAGPDVEKSRLEDLRQRLAAAGVRLGGGETGLSEAWRSPTEVRYYDERDAESAEALAFWLARSLTQPTRARLQRDASVPRGELHVRLAR